MNNPYTGELLDKLTEEELHKERLNRKINLRVLGIIILLSTIFISFTYALLYGNQ